MKRLKRVAIFDIDGTIFRSSLLIELTEALIHDGVFSKGARKVYAHSYKNWLERKAGYEKYIAAVVRAYEREIRGVRRRDFLHTARKVVAFHQNRIYRYSRDLVRDLRRESYYLLAISGSPREVVDEFCKKLGFNKVYGRIYEVDRFGQFTGKTLYADLISDKAKILKRAVEKEGLTLRHSIGVGDTESDIPFLKMVERPICFNPNQPLFKAAKKRRWPVVVERKDVIYKL